MARPAKLNISVTWNRNSSTVHYVTQGQYRSFTVNDVTNTVKPAPVFTTSGSRAMWEAVLALVLADITAGNGGGS
jgi:hypothetical protein